ncbi:MAG: hypothetical protein LLG97_16185 [Deltaproteobacteria bacterium]|nr:hypothetical protein [Deltaproteobacteria bacterium]
MVNIIRTVAEKVKLPPWWVEAIAVEYVECREFATRDEIWTFNFEKLAKNDLMEALKTHHVVVSSLLVHNVLPFVFSARIFEGMFSRVPAGLCAEQDDLIPEGLASDHCFPWQLNALDVWDPKLSIFDHFQVLNDGKFWQWRFAESMAIEGRHYSRTVSDEVDLGVFDLVHEKLAALRNPVIKPGEPGHADFKIKVADFYQWPDGVRRPILSELEKLHFKKCRSRSSFPKVTRCEPPILSRFESFTVRDSSFHTRFFGEAIFFRGCHQHAKKADELAQDERPLVMKLDEVYQERANAIILGAACLEAFINHLGYDHFPKYWEGIEKLSFMSKWQIYLALAGKGATFDSSREPYQSLFKLTKKRNLIMHSKGHFMKVTQNEAKTIPHTELDMPREFVHELPSRIKDLIRELCEATQLPVPVWLTPMPNLGWM